MRIISDRDGRLHAADLGPPERPVPVCSHQFQLVGKQTLPLYITRLQTHRTQSSMSVPRTFH